jgi:hypothetical protein
VNPAFFQDEEGLGIFRRGGQFKAFPEADDVNGPEKNEAFDELPLRQVQGPGRHVICGPSQVRNDTGLDFPEEFQAGGYGMLLQVRIQAGIGPQGAAWGMFPVKQ